MAVAHPAPRSYDRIRMPRPAGTADSAGLLGRFALVGACGYVVNLSVFGALEALLRTDHVVSGSVAFAAAVTTPRTGSSAPSMSSSTPRPSTASGCTGTRRSV